MRTREEVLDELPDFGGHYYFEDALSAMSTYAAEIAIAFGEYIERNKYYIHDGLWYTMSESPMRNAVTSKELYDEFMNDKK